MAFEKAFVESSVPHSGGIQLVVVFVDEVEGRKERHDFFISSQGTLDSVKNILRSYVNGLGTEDTLLKDLMPGTSIDLTPDPPPPPSLPPDPDPAVIAREAYVLALSQWRAARRQIDDGIVKVDDADALVLFAEAQKLYTPAYLILG